MKETSGRPGSNRLSTQTVKKLVPSEAIEGMPKLPFELGMTSYDDPPPERLGHGELEALRDRDGFREANELRAWIEVDDGKIVISDRIEILLEIEAVLS